MLQYQHYLFKVNKGTAYQDDSGRWVPGSGNGYEYVCRCRYEADGRGSFLTMADGKHVVITGVIYAGVMDQDTLKGCEVIVSTDKYGNDVLCNKIVNMANYGRLNTKLYV